MLRDEIIEATQALIAEKGYGAMSMEELAARVGVSKPTLYNQFPTKEHIVIEVSYRMMEQFVSLAEEYSSDTPLERLCRILHTAIQLQVEAHTTVAQIWMPELLHILTSHSATFELMQRLDELVVEMIHKAIKQGEIRPELEPAAVVRVFYTMFCVPNVGGHSKAGAVDESKLADRLVSIFRSGVQASEKTRA